MDQVTRPGAGGPESSAPQDRQPEPYVRPAGEDAGELTARGPRVTEGRAGRLRRASLAAISANPRLPIWERRVAIALVAGIAVTFIFRNWRIGLTVAVLAAIADTIHRSHTSAAMPPARRAGAQRKTERKLGRLSGAGYRALNERAIPGSEAIIDHLVIGPTGVYAIHSERWDRRLPVRVLGGKQLFHGPFSTKERLEEARWKAARAAELLSDALGRAVGVRPSILIYGPKIHWAVMTVRSVDVISGDHMRKYLRRGVKAGRGPRLTAQEIEDLHDAAARVLPERF